MEFLNWELSVLSRAVAYPNLSGAAANIGISQPQLSRIVAGLEKELGVKLLDRAAKRHSSWTGAALKLTESYSRTFDLFQREVTRLSSEALPDRVRIGTLEGLIGIALRFTRHLMAALPVRLIELNVQDLNLLEEEFGKRHTDLILTSREPGRKSYARSRLLGYQSLDKTAAKAAGPQVMSSFEYGTAGVSRKPGAGRVLVSNSLEVRRAWIEQLGGQGILPSEVRKQRSGKPGEVAAMLIGADDFPDVFWEKAGSFK